MPIKAFFAAVIVAVTVAACTRRGAVVRVDVPDASGLTAESPVRFRGTQIGHVRAILPLRNGSRLELVLDRPDAPVRAADRVAVLPDGIFGASFVDIVP